MKSCSPAVQNCHPKDKLATQSGYTLIELMIIIAVIGVLAAIGVGSYQLQLRQTQMMSIYQEINAFRTPYQMLIDQGAGVTDFSPSGLNLPRSTQYCQFTVVGPITGGATPNAVTCVIKDLPYLQAQSLSMDYLNDGKWQCHASSGIKVAYLPKACR
ncbi:pilin [Psychrobacter sp. K31L]|uniref:pilin n=1 Tax=Psychrobacter sp. K31L TaxID=2820758 RepID=UPI001B33DFCC|nr:pilin [Psychrobacter sp. K31L]MBP3946438.1 pilin [Psychrobacter sp. K31L]